MRQYHEALEYIMKNGVDKPNRTGIDTRQVFGYQMRFNLQDGFPAVTTKKLAWRAVVSELLWFMEGSSDERRLCEILHGTRDPNKRTIWTDNADKQGVDLGYRNDDEVKELGPIYGVQWRSFGGIRKGTDQLQNVIEDLIYTPESRRIIMSAWNPNEIDNMALPPCHVMSQYVVTSGKLSCMMTQRSADFALGVPFNIASYALLTHILAELTGLDVGELVMSFGDAHIYHNHFDGVKEQLTRAPYDLPVLKMPSFVSLSDVLASKVDQYILEGYKYHPTIKMDMAV